MNRPYKPSMRSLCKHPITQLVIKVYIQYFLINALCTHIFDLNAELLTLSNNVTQLQKPIFTSPRPTTTDLETKRQQKAVAAAKAMSDKRINKSFALERSIIEAEVKLKGFKTTLEKPLDGRSSGYWRMKKSCDAPSLLVGDMWGLYAMAL